MFSVPFFQKHTPPPGTSWLLRNTVPWCICWITYGESVLFQSKSHLYLWKRVSLLLRPLLSSLCKTRQALSAREVNPTLKRLEMLFQWSDDGLGEEKKCCKTSKHSHRHFCSCVLTSGEAEGWAWSERGVGQHLPRGGGRTFLLAGTKDAPPASNLPGFWLHAATLHRLPSWVCRPQLTEGEREQHLWHRW